VNFIAKKVSPLKKVKPLKAGSTFGKSQLVFFKSRLKDYFF